jgi:hypothetical protein
MGNTFAWPIIRLIQRLSVVLTLCCCAYVILFLLSQSHNNFLPENSKVVPLKGIDLTSSSAAFDLRPYQETGQMAQARDIFSLNTSVSSSGDIENTAQGQFLDHLRIVGILISHPSQIIVEDSLAKKTYFIDEGTSQAGIKIVRVGKERMIINYQGQDISVPINRS